MIKGKELYIWHHLGMGDHYTCNGIVRHYAERYEKIYLFFKDPYKKNVRFLYRDLDNIEFIDGGIHEDHLAKGFALMNPTKNIMQIGYNYLNNTKLQFDAAFYEQAGIPFEYRWSKFYMKRDMEKEKEVYYDILKLKDNEEYIFLHDHPDYETKQVPNDIKIIKPDNWDLGIHDYLYTMEQSKELHLMNSAILPLVDTMQMKHDKLFYHAYIRNIDMGLKLNWNIIR
jgi:hypothetical protein